MRSLLRVCAAVALLCVTAPAIAQAPVPAPAATTVTSGATAPTSTVTVPPSTNPTTVVVPPTTAVETPAWLNMLAVFGVAIIMGLVGIGIGILNKKAGLEQNAAVIQIEAHARDALQSALTNLAGRVVMQLGPKINDAVLNIQSPLIRQAALELPNLAGDALKLFGITSSDQVAQKIIDKIGVLTASNPNANPVSDPTAKPTTASVTPSTAA